MSNNYVIRHSENGNILFRFPAELSGDSSALVKGQPREVTSLIGSYLSPRDLVRAQGVSKAWYWAFGIDSIWIPHLPFSCNSLSKFPPKVQLAYLALRRKCFIEGEVTVEEMGGIESHQRNLSGVQLSADGRTVLSYDRYGKIVLWKGFGGEKCVPQMLSKGIGEGGIIALSPDGKCTFIAEKNMLIRWKGFLEEEMTLGEVKGNIIGLKGLKLSPDGKWGLTFGWGGFVVYWSDLSTDSFNGVFLVNAKSNHQEVEGCSISSDGSWALTLTRDTIVRWSGFLSGDVIATVVLDNPHGTERMVDCAISPDGTWALSVGENKVVKWVEWDNDSPTGIIVAGEEIPECNPHNRSPAREVTFSPDGSWALTWDLDTFFVWYDLEKDELSYATHKMFRADYLRHVIVSPDSSWLVSFASKIHLFRPKCFLEEPNTTEE